MSLLISKVQKAVLTALAVVLFTLPVITAVAQVKPRDPVVQVTIVSEMRVVAPGETIWIAMHQNIYPGWHTYWLNAGDAGAAPTLDWHLPEGYSVGALNFPPPERIPYMDLMNFGYSDEVVLPMQLSVPGTAMPGEVVTLDADAHWLVCEEICIPEDGKVSLRIRIGPANVRDETWGPIIDETRGNFPAPAPFETDFALAEGTIDLVLKSVELAGAFRSGTVQEAVFFPRQEGLIENAAEQNFIVTDEGLRLLLPRGYAEDDFQTINGLFVFTQDLADGTITNAFSFEGTRVAALAPVAAQASGFAAIIEALVLAFLGGIILNIMPCVFPVLFIKALAFMKHKDTDAAKLRLEGLSYTAGVVLSFALLGGALLALRAGGEAVGWGFQLQTPAIVGGLAFLLFAVGLSLSGVFSIGGSLAGVGSGLAERTGQWGSFFTGVLATLVAAPCTAPFMGAAMGFALTQSTVTALLVFIFVGAGMALPFLLLAFFPALAARLPKPGRWMERVKQVLAFPMYGAAAWLTWVFALQTEPNALFALLLGFVLIGFGLWVFEVTRDAKGAWPHLGKGAALLSLLATLVFLIQIKTPALDAQAALSGNRITNGLAYEPFSEARVEELTSAGKPVFVNFTAAWCISCLANEKLVFRSDDVRKLFEESGITYLKADWTNRDPNITRALAKFGRAGVPLYLYYSGEPGAEPEILPQILTVGIVLEALGG